MKTLTRIMVIFAMTIMITESAFAQLGQDQILPLQQDERASNIYQLTLPSHFTQTHITVFTKRLSQHETIEAVDIHDRKAFIYVNANGPKNVATLSKIILSQTQSDTSVAEDFFEGPQSPSTPIEKGSSSAKPVMEQTN